MRKFNRTKGDRALFLKNIAHNLVLKERMLTTEARAKEIRPLVERLVTIAKRGDVVSFRRLCAMLPKVSAEKLFHDLAPRYKDRKGGMLRITLQAKTRRRDGAHTAVIEFV